LHYEDRELCLSFSEFKRRILIVGGEKLNGIKVLSGDMSVGFFYREWAKFNGIKVLFEDMKTSPSKRLISFSYDQYFLQAF